MPDNNDQIKSRVVSVVFVCGYSIAISKREKLPISRWYADPDDDKSIAEYLADCEILGWPVFIRNQVAYVYKADEAVEV